MWREDLMFGLGKGAKRKKGVKVVIYKTWRKNGAVAIIISSRRGREASIECKPCWPGEVQFR